MFNTAEASQGFNLSSIGGRLRWDQILDEIENELPTMEEEMGVLSDHPTEDGNDRISSNLN